MSGVIKREDCIHPKGGCPWACDGYIPNCAYKEIPEHLGGKKND